ncbi:TerB family tellurite resistance protein [Mucilaginibacter sp.]
MALLSLFAWNIDAVRAQSQEVQQLLLDVEKLSQFKSILSDMERGYAQLSQGYNAVRNVTQGNFNLHQVFLDGLLTVNPNVKKYRRVADIIEVESSILSEYKKAWKRSNSSGSFSLTELNYISSVYGNLTSQALRNLNDLITVLTASQLRMSDDERLREIDRIYTDISDKLIFLRSFNRQTDMMRLQRSKELSDTQTLQKLYIK